MGLDADLDVGTAALGSEAPVAAAAAEGGMGEQGGEDDARLLSALCSQPMFIIDTQTLEAHTFAHAKLYKQTKPPY
jgi:hypothetical protein